MYKLIVRSKVRSTFASINSGDYLPMVNSMASSFAYRFHGEHALGGRRTSREAMIRWWERVFRLLPGAQFDIQEILVNGAPWNTRIAIRSLISGPLPGGTQYSNTVFQFMTLSWGRVTSVETIEDLQVLEQALRVVGDAGEREAIAAAITD